MPNAWGGADPVQQVDAADYEMGCEYVANVNITLTHIRVWTGAAEVAVTNRRGRIWSTDGVQLGIATLPDDLPTGWSAHPLDVPLERLTGARWKVSWSSGGNWTELAGGHDTAVNSSDGAVTAVAGSQGTHGNGSFKPTLNSFPDEFTPNNSFYGADCTYALGTAPRITEATVTAAGAVATATIVAEDDETLAGASYRYDWGDGSAVTSSGSATAQHTYSVSGTYAVLMSVTDADGLDDHAAAPVTVVVPPAVAAYATIADLEAWLGTDAPAGAELLLARASIPVDMALVATVYPVDGDGLPTDTTVIAALRDAACAQVEWWVETGDALGSSGGWQSVQIGSVRLARGAQGTARSAPRLAPRAADILALAGLLPGTPITY